jgi:uncharacterized protein associated with vWA-MoxR-VMAP ternary system
MPARSTDRNPIAPEQRNKVLWLGPPPAKAAFVEACETHGLVLQQVAPNEVEGIAPTARAVLLPVPNPSPTFNKWSRKVFNEARKHGLLAALVLQTDAKAGHMPPEAHIKAYFRAFRRFEQEGLVVRGFYYEWAVIAHDLMTIQVEPGANRSLILRGSLPTNDEAELLLRRAFYDFTSLELEALSGGRSGADIWRISGVLDTGRPSALSLVAKISTPEKIAAERSACSIIESSVPHRLYAPIVNERCLTGADRAIATYRFISHSNPITDRIGDVGAQLVTSLFKQTLAGLHEPTRPFADRIATYFGPQRLKAFRWTDDLTAAAVHSRESSNTLPSAEELQQLIDELPKATVATGTVHGDLHVGNLFVPIDTHDVVIIDYGSVQHNAPLVADPACLEVSIIFSTYLAGQTANIGHSALQQGLTAAYKYPLEASQTRTLEAIFGKGVASAVRQVRKQAKALDPNPSSYAIAVAAYLVRFAAFSENGSIADRAVAYKLAAILVADAGSAMHRELGRRRRLA